MYDKSSKSSFSVSRIPIEIIVGNKGRIKAELVRHFAPLTISEILKRLPLSGRVHYNLDNFCYIQTQLNLGPEKQKKDFKANDIAYLTLNGSFCFFIKQTTTAPMNHIGKIISEIDPIKRVEPTDILTLKQIVMEYK